MRTEELILISNLDQHEMHGVIYRPDTIKAIVLFIHGMSEHQGRYQEILMEVAKQDFLVLAPDLRGHGNSPVDLTMGYFGKKNGFFFMVRDLYQLVNKIRESYNVPVILIGHSLGALFALEYLKRYPKNIAGVFLSGTPSNHPELTMLKPMLAPLLSKSSKKPNDFIRKQMYQNFSREIGFPKSEYEWLSTNRDNQLAYQNDPLCDFPLTSLGYMDMLNLISDVYNNDSWHVDNPTLPIVAFNGMHDPVSNAKGTALNKTIAFITKKGYKNVSKQLYSSSRHEILFDDEKDVVIKDLLYFLSKII